MSIELERSFLEVPKTTGLFIHWARRTGFRLFSTPARVLHCVRDRHPDSSANMKETPVNFGDNEGFYPGRVFRVGPPVDWSVIRSISFERGSLPGIPKPSSTRKTEITPHRTGNESNVEQDARKHAGDTSGRREVEHSSALPGSNRGSGSAGVPASMSSLEKLETLLLEQSINLDAVKKVSWAGLPSPMRAPIWKILLGYLPTSLSRRRDTLQRRRREYREAVDLHYSPASHKASREHDQATGRVFNRTGDQEDMTMRQIAIDIPRTCPGHALFHIPEVQLALERILYVWATRHPASGYVQGMNDLVTPFVFVFLSEYAPVETEKPILQMTDMSAFDKPEEALSNAEADSYWCLTALLNDIQDYYTFSQPGIQRRVHYLRELVARVDASLCAHLEDEGLDFLQFAFRWMNCLLMRELPFPLIVRVWDTYLAESDGFALFHVYVCAALLVSFSEELQEMDFQDIVMFLQNLPTDNWTSKEIDVILSQAYMWRTIFGAAPSHLQ